MRTRLLSLLAVLAAATAVGLPASAQQQAPGTPAPEKKSAAASSQGGKLIPKLELEGVPLLELLSFLREADPDFQAVVSGPGAEGGGPIIQELRLKNVSAAAVLQLLAESYPQVQVNPLQPEGSDSVIWAIRVLGPQAPGGGGFYGGAAGGEMGMGGAVPTGAAQPVTTVYRLREIIDDLARDSAGAGEDRKRAREAVMSLVQTTIETQGGDGPPAAIKLHEATETLVFRGTFTQAHFVDQALGTLRPLSGDAAAQGETRRELRKLAAEVKELKQRLSEQQGEHGVAPPTPGEPNQPKQ